MPKSTKQPWAQRMSPRLGISWPLYKSEYFRDDLIAGLTTAVMLIPQGMAYALLAGLPPIVGLYAAVVPLVAYAMAGSSRELAVGPVAMDSLLTAATVGVLAESGSDRYIELATMLALLTGVIQVALGVLRGGFLVNFLSRPVISGFTSAAAIIIGVSQLRLLFGIDLPRSTSVFEIAIDLLRHLSEVHLPTLAIAFVSIVMMFGLKRWAPRWPRALFVVIFGIAATSLLGLAEQGVDIVGEVPPGMPSPKLPIFDSEAVSQLMAGAMTIAFVAFMEGISIATKLSEKSGHRIDANREFFALGFANVGAGLFGAFPVAGGLSRTAVNAEAGARTKLAGLLTAATVALTLSFFTGILFYVPKASLGAIIIMAVFGLIDLQEPQRLWKIKRSDFFTLVVTFAATLGLGIQQGILVGVGLSIFVILVRTTQPHTAVLGRLPGTEIYRNVEHFAQAELLPGILIVRLDAQFYFGNINYLKKTLSELEEQLASAKPDETLHAVIIDASGMNQIDGSAESALRTIAEGYRDRGIHFQLASVKGPVREVLERSGFATDFHRGTFPMRVHDAVTQVLGSEAEARVEDSKVGASKVVGLG